jgi:hypothetical protein
MKEPLCYFNRYTQLVLSLGVERNKDVLELDLLGDTCCDVRFLICLVKGFGSKI